MIPWWAGLMLFTVGFIVGLLFWDYHVTQEAKNKDD